MVDQKNVIIDRRESLIIKEPVPINFTMQNFNGKVFNSPPSSPPFYGNNIQNFQGQNAFPVIYQRVISPPIMLQPPPTKMCAPIQVASPIPPPPSKVIYHNPLLINSTQQPIGLN